MHFSELQFQKSYKDLKKLRFQTLINFNKYNILFLILI